jgi:DNA-binding MarR family transcriptional regulator
MKAMDIIKTVMEDQTLTPVEKVLFAILYCRRQGEHCQLTVQEIIQRAGAELGTIQRSLEGLEQAGFIRLRENCEITDATSLLSCTILVRSPFSAEARTPRP